MYYISNVKKQIFVLLVLSLVIGIVMTFVGNFPFKNLASLGLDILLGSTVLIASRK